MRVVRIEEDLDGVEFGEWPLDRIRGKTGEAEESKKWFEKMLWTGRRVKFSLLQVRNAEML